MTRATDDDLYLPAHVQLSNMRAEVFSPRDLTEAYLARITAINPSVRGVVAMAGEQALREADLAKPRLEDTAQLKAMDVRVDPRVTRDRQRAHCGPFDVDRP